MSFQSPKKILVIRADRIGDLILSTPAIKALKEQSQESSICVGVRKENKSLVDGLPFVDSVFEYDPLARHSGGAGLIRLIQDLRELKADIAVVLQSQPRLSTAIYLSGIKTRIGPLSKPHSYICFNEGVRQKRSEVKYHEAEYNILLLEKLLSTEVVQKLIVQKIDPSVKVDAEAIVKARAWLSSLGWNFVKPLICIHPGMGGSAENWTLQNYIDLGRRINNSGYGVVVSAGPSEFELLGQFKSQLGQKDGIYYFGDEGNNGLTEFVALLSISDLVIAPSTGPLHLAVALGKPVMSFFPKIRVQSKERWGPYGRLAAGQALVLEPEPGKAVSSISLEKAVDNFDRLVKKVFNKEDDRESKFIPS